MVAELIYIHLNEIRNAWMKVVKSPCIGICDILILVRRFCVRSDIRRNAH